MPATSITNSAARVSKWRPAQRASFLGLCLSCHQRSSFMTFPRTATRIALGVLLAVPTLAHGQAATAARPTAPKPTSELPLKYTGKPTTAPISTADLMTRLYIYADDSLMGRQVGSEYNLKATAYIEREVRRLGLVPAGEAGGYFQNIPLYLNYADTAASSMKIGDQTLAFGTDYLPVPRVDRAIALDGVPVVYGGVSADSSTWPTADAVKGKIVVLTVANVPGPMRATFS